MFVLTEVALQTGHGQEWLRPTFEIADFASLENKENKSRSKQNHTNKTSKHFCYKQLPADKVIPSCDIHNF